MRGFERLLDQPVVIVRVERSLDAAGQPVETERRLPEVRGRLARPTAIEREIADRMGQELQAVLFLSPEAPALPQRGDRVEVAGQRFRVARVEPVLDARRPLRAWLEAVS